MSGEGAAVPRILLVDDVPENLFALEALLRRDGLAIDVADSGRAALELLLVHDYAVALVDVFMPEMDGIELAELMRGSARTRGVPIIFVTANYDEPRRVFRGYDAGAVEYLIKPIDARLLRTKVQTFIRLSEQSRQLSETLRTHELFVAALGHDLRNPLAAIVTGVGFLLDRPTGPVVGPDRAVLSRIDLAARRMQEMVDQLHVLAQARAGTPLAPTWAPVDLGAVVTNAVAEHAVIRPGRDVPVTRAGDLHGVWDASWMARVVGNLLGNAATHGDAGRPITIDIDGRNPSSVTLAVHNRGCIPAATMRCMFDPFRSGARTGGTGLGLGLFIVQTLVEAQHGTVTATTSVIAGTTFTIVLPRAPTGMG